MSDWTTQAADAIEKGVDLVRDKTVVPAQRGAKAVVYGFLAAFFVLTAAILLVILLFRVLNIGLPVWASWLVLGGIFVAAGAFCWTRRTPSDRGTVRA
jgi:hypothetical protein